ncbi:MAG TPA: hypothetical protein VK993_01295, partial [Chthoniobacterales bacterium]|nr:hypothetical protein [Chthoniobacterales bacterium]
FALWFCAALLLCNLPLFATKISAPWRGIAREMDAAIGGHGGITRSVPHADYLQMLGETVPPSILILAAAYVGVLLWFRRSRTPAELMTVLLALLYLAILSSSPKIAPRYLIPVTTLLGLLAVCGAAELSRLICGERRARKVAAVVLFAVFTGWLGRDMLQAYQPARLGFERDDPTAAAEWITNNLPPDAVIAEDGSVSLSPSRPGVKIGVASRVPQKVLEAYFAADLGSLDELRSQGVTHVAVSEKMYGRYFAGEGSARKGMSDVYETRRRFYERVLAEGELLAEWPRGINSYLQPGIRIYRVAPPANGATSGSST